MDIDAVESRIAELERRISTVAEVSAREKLYVGVDLGTAYIVVVVVNGSGEPVACALEFAQVVRDGLVVDYVGATQIVRRLVGQLQERLGRELEDAAIAVPPGTGVRECATHRHVVEGAGLNVISILDEPTAANAVLNVDEDTSVGILRDIEVPHLTFGIAAAAEIGYPVLVRPSFVLGGRAMQIVANEQQLRQYLKTAVEIDEDRPVLVDKYIIGKEVEVVIPEI